MLRRLPLPPEALSKRSDDLFSLRASEGSEGSDPDARVDPGTFIAMSEMYRDLLTHPAWLDYTGHLLGMSAAMERTLIQGTYAADGSDQTPIVRAGYCLLQDILTIPDKLEQRRQYIETELLGVPPTPRTETTTTWTS